MKAYPKRIEPLDPARWRDDVREIVDARVGGRPIPNVYRTMAHHPDLMRSWLALGEHILFHSTLRARDRELVILRIGWLCQAPYEWFHHSRLGREAGLTDEDIRRIEEGPEAAGWNRQDRLLLKATDELHERAHISDTVWDGLRESFGTQELMDVVFTAGQYNLVCMALNSFGVELEAPA